MKVRPPKFGMPLGYGLHKIALMISGEGTGTLHLREASW